MDAFLAFVARVTNASVDGADCARVALTVVASSDGRGPCGHGVDSGGGCLFGADVVGTADISVSAIRVDHATVRSNIRAHVVGAFLTNRAVRIDHAANFHGG